MALRRSLGVLAERPFRIFFVGRTISTLGSAITPLALTFAVLGLGASAAQLGLVLAAATVPKLVFILLGGVAGDRFERRRILISTDLVMGACQAATAVLLIGHVAQIWHLVLIQLVSGTAAAFFAPASTGVVPDVVSAPRLQQANALLGMSRNISGLIGPAIAGALVALASPAWAFVVDAATFGLSALALARLPTRFGVMTSRTSLVRDLVDGWREFTSRTWVWTMVLSFGVYQATVLPTILVLGPVLADEELGGATAWAAILTGRSAGALLIGLVLLRWRPRRPLVASTLIIMLDVPFVLLLGLGAPLALIVVAGALSAAAVVGADTVWETTLQEQVPEHALSRVSSYDWLGSLAINPLGFALIGVLAQSYGIGSIVAAVLVIHVAMHGALLALPAIRGLQRRADAPATGPATDTGEVAGTPMAPLP